MKHGRTFLEIFVTRKYFSSSQVKYRFSPISQKQLSSVSVAGSKGLYRAGCLNLKSEWLWKKWCCDDDLFEGCYDGSWLVLLNTQTNLPPHQILTIKLAGKCPENTMQPSPSASERRETWSISYLVSISRGFLERRTMLSEDWEWKIDQN